MTEKPLVQNAADRTQVKEAGRMEKYGRERELDDIRTVLSTVAGRRFFWRLLGKCGVFQSSYSESVNRINFNEGRRDIGLSLLADITEADPNAYLMMMNESRRENG